MRVLMPMLGQMMTEGTITKWLRREGDQVRKGEPLFEVETDKVTLEVESPHSGVLRILTEENQTVAVGEPVGVIEQTMEEKT